jgi:glucose-6-phosphate dehydrogenase assembly protein OpcA
LASALIDNAQLREIEEELCRLRDAVADPAQTATLRTRVMTHLAWVPLRWEQAARATLAGLEERHPSRTIALFPDPESERDALDADVDVRFFEHGLAGRPVASEVISIWLRGRRTQAPASVVQPLLVSDLPVFLRWRGAPPFRAPELEQLLGVADRLVIDGEEWDEPDVVYLGLTDLFERIAVSDIAWRRTLPWREALARLWPDIADLERITVTSPPAEAYLLAGWLSGRLGRNVALDHEAGSKIELVEVDGRPVTPPYEEHLSASDLLSGELEQFGRDPIYEEAVRSFSLQTTS